MKKPFQFIVLTCVVSWAAAGAAILLGANNAIAGIAGFIALLLVNTAFYLYDKYITKEKIFTRTIGEY